MTVGFLTVAAIVASCSTSSTVEEEMSSGVESKPSKSSTSAFVTVWDIRHGTELTLPLDESGTYDFTVDWGDGSRDVITEWDQAETTHDFEEPGEYTVIIEGVIKGWRMDIQFGPHRLVRIEQWGNLGLGNSGGYFQGAENLEVTATDTPELEGTTTMERAFMDCRTLSEIPSIHKWDMSSIEDMRSMFSGAENFDQDIGNWDVSSVKNMENMFRRARSFNQDIGGWNVASVKNMSSMFWDADSFNQDIGQWNVSSVKNMEGMFFSANSFNQDIGQWNVSSVNDMSRMFSGTHNFNQDIGQWNVSSVKNMEGMFSDAKRFNQDLSHWDISSVENMRNIFLGADNFDQNIDDWGWELTTTNGDGPPSPRPRPRPSPAPKDNPDSSRDDGLKGDPFDGEF